MSNIERITIKDNEEFLRQISKEVDFNDKSYLDDIKKLEEYCIHNTVFAMAAVQIGISKRIIYLKNTTSDLDKNIGGIYNEAKVLINPVILKRLGHVRYLEGCASCLTADNKFIVGLVDRPYLTEIEYYDIYGNKQKEVFKGMASIVFSHEYDHLNGVLHMDLTNEIMVMNYKQMRNYREQNPIEIIDKENEYENKSFNKK